MPIRTRVAGSALTIAAIVFNAAVLGPPTIGLDLALVLAYALWVAAPWQLSRDRVLGPFVLGVALFCLHFADEYLTGFPLHFPALFGVEWAPQRFVGFNLIWLAVFIATAFGVYMNSRLSYLIVIFFAIGGGIGNGLGHVALSLYERRVFPGTSTGLFMFGVGILLLRQLREPTEQPRQPPVDPLAPKPLAKALLVLQGVMFTLLVPGTVALWMPQDLILHGDLTIRNPLGWLLIVPGATLYFWCAAQFLLRGHGTPNISFASHFGFLIGREPLRLVQGSIYSRSRNPMYLGVLAVLFGEAILFANIGVLIYAVAGSIWFHLVVILIEEPHLRQTRGASYEEYCRATPRWFPKPGGMNYPDLLEI